VELNLRDARFEELDMGCGWRAKAPLQLVHIEILGLARNPIVRGKRYFLLFVNNYSRMMWVYLLE